MPIEATIHARLDADTALSTLVGNRFFPSESSVNADLPAIVYTVTSAETGNYTSGPSDLTKYSFTIDCRAVKASELWPVMDRVKAVLHGWRGGIVQHCFETSSNTDQQERGYHGAKTFTLWAAEGNVVALVDSTGVIFTGDGSVTLQVPCGETTSQLEFTCDGLHLDGEPFTGGTGPQGEPGEPGEQGETGPAGPGVASGGTTGQLLLKASGTNYDTAWSANLTWDNSTKVLTVNDPDTSHTLTLDGDVNGAGGRLTGNFGLTLDGGGSQIEMIANARCKFIPTNGVARVEITQDHVKAGVPLNFNSNADISGGSVDTGLARDSAGVVRVTDGSSGTATIKAGVRPPHIADSSAANDTIYFSTDQNKLCYKDSGSVVHDLY